MTDRGLLVTVRRRTLAATLGTGLLAFLGDAAYSVCMAHEPFLTMLVAPGASILLRRVLLSIIASLGGWLLSHSMETRARALHRLRRLRQARRSLTHIRTLTEASENPLSELVLRQVCESLVSLPDYEAAALIMPSDQMSIVVGQAGFGDEAVAALLADFAQDDVPVCIRRAQDRPGVMIWQRACAACQLSLNCKACLAIAWDGLTYFRWTLILGLRVERPLTAEERAFHQELVDSVGFILRYGALQRVHLQTHDALERESYRLAEVFRTAPVGIFEMTDDGAVLSLNGALTAMLGYVDPENARAELTTVMQEVLFGATAVGRFAEKLRARGQVQNIELSVPRRDGTPLWLLVSARRLAASPTGEGRIIGFVRDVTGRKQTESALRESQRTLATLLRNLPGMAYRCLNDARRTMQFVSQGCSALTGYGPEELVNNRHAAYVDLVVPEDRARVWADMQDALAHGQPYELVYRIRTAQGDVKWVWEQGRAVPVPGEGFEVLEGLVLDVTAAHQAELERERLLAQLRAQAARLDAQARELRQIINAVPEGVLLLDSEGYVVQANVTAQTYLAQVLDLGRSVTGQSLVGQRLTQLGDRQVEELLTSPPVSGLWHEIHTPTRVFQALAQPLSRSPDSPGWVLVLQDVTQSRDIQRRMQQQERLASLGQLAAGIAHDFNNMLAVVTLYTQAALSDSSLPDRLHAQLEAVISEVDRAGGLIRQILDFGRQTQMELQHLDLLPFLKEQVALLARLLPESIEVGFQYDQGDYLILGDPTRLAQVLLNLALNARDAMPNGGQLRLELGSLVVDKSHRAPLLDLTPGRWITLSVSDTGTGMPPEVVAHLFEPFFTTKGVQGNGLGLSQVHGIVGQHGGFIDVSTEQGRGTTFTLYLPALVREEGARHALNRDVDTLTLERGHGERILVVEDDAAVRESLAAALELLGYRVRTAANGREALTFFDEEGADAVDLVLCDWVMPIMGGQALLSELKARGISLPFVVLTGHPMDQLTEVMALDDVVDKLQKPPDLLILAETVGRILRTGEQSPITL